MAQLIAVPAASQDVLPPASGTPGVAGEARTVEGRLLLGGSATPRPVGREFVVLHRIAADTSGPVDSVRTNADGAWRFRYRLAGPRSMYIVSTRYSGVAYFTAPLRERDVRGADAELLVYDTTSRAFPLTIRARHFVIAPPDGGGQRRVVDVFDVANDSGLTRVGGSSGAATWRVRLPEGASDPAASGGDMPPEAFRFVNGHAELTVPFPPGSRQLVLTYAMPSRGLEVPLDEATGTLEVLVEGGGAAVNGAGMVAEDAVTMEGRTFQRYVASQAPAGSAFSVRGPRGGSATRVALLGVAAAAVALGIVLGRRGTPAAPAEAATTGADAIARAIAALDHVEATARDDAAREALRARRDRLLAELDAALAVEDADGTR